MPCEPLLNAFNAKLVHTVLREPDHRAVLENASDETIGDHKREKLGRYCFYVNFCKLNGDLYDGVLQPSKQVVCLLSPQSMQCVGQEVKVAQPLAETRRKR